MGWNTQSLSVQQQRYLLHIILVARHVTSVWLNEGLHNFRLFAIVSVILDGKGDLRHCFRPFVRSSVQNISGALTQQSLGRLTPNQVYLNHLGLYVCNVVVICPSDPHGRAHGLNKCPCNLAMPELSNHRANSPQIKFIGTVWVCITATSWSFSHRSPVLSPGIVDTDGLRGQSIGPWTLLHTFFILWAGRTPVTCLIHS